jgi:hypothetical protein
LEGGGVGDVEHGGVFVDAFHEAGEGGAGAEFDEAGEALGEEVTHGFFPADGGGDLIDEFLVDFAGGVVGLGGDVADDGNAGEVERNLGEGGAEFWLGAGHEGRVVGAGDGERESAFGAEGFGEFAGFVDPRLVPRDDELAGAIKVGELNARFGADFAGGRFVEADDGSHRARGGFAGFLHELTALANDFQAVFKGHHADGGEGGEFAEAQAGGGFELEIGDAFFEKLKADPAYEVNAGLGIFGFGELGLGALEANLREVVTENGIGAIENGAGAGECFGEILSHADGLGPLPCEQ